MFVVYLSFSAWLNNCVGYGNHRYFFLYMLYTVVGSLFLIMFGLEIAYNVLWLGDDEWSESEPLEGHPITYNLTGHIVPIVSQFFYYIITRMLFSLVIWIFFPLEFLLFFNL